MHKLLSGFIVTVLLVGLLAGCAPTAAPGAAPAQSGATPAQAGEEAAPAAAGATTLTVWDVSTREEDSNLMDKLVADFEAAHPGVEVNRVVKSFDDLKATAKLALAAPDGPDVVQVNQGWSDMGAMVQGGLLTDLTAYAKQYGWDQKISPGIVARNSFSPDGKTFGSGSLYGVPPVAELVGVYYRKDLFDQYGLTVPKTFAEFETILAKLKEAGEVPLVFGNVDGWPAGQTLGELIGVNLADRTMLDDLIFATGNGASWNSPEVLSAAEKLVEWVDKGYFTEGFAGIGYDESGNMFNTGQGAMMLTGSWMASVFQAGPNADNIGFFLVPPKEEDGFKLSTGGTSLAYAIRASSPNQDLSAEFIDWMMSDEAAQGWVGVGIVPVAPVESDAVEPGTLFGDLVTSWQSMNAGDEVGHYLDWASPTFYDTLTASLQELMAKQITPQEFVDKLEADHQAFLQQKGQ